MKAEQKIYANQQDNVDVSKPMASENTGDRDNNSVEITPLSSHERAQELFDTAVHLAKINHARVIVDVHQDDTNIQVIKDTLRKPPPLPAFDESSPSVKTKRDKRETDHLVQKGKEHDVTGLTGFYKGVYYEHGIARKSNKTKKK